MGENYLIVTEKSDIDTEGDVFRIDDELSEYSSEKCERVYDNICSLSVESPTNLPLFELISQKTAKPGPESLLISILLYQKIESTIKSKKQMDTIKAVDLPQIYASAVKDVAESHELAYEEDEIRDSTGSVLTHFKIILTYFIYLLDQIIALICTQFISSKDSTLAVLPAYNEDVEPVLERLNENGISYTILSRYPFALWILTQRRNSTGIWEPTRSLNEFSSVNTIIQEAKLLAILVSESFIKKTMNKSLKKAISKEMGVNVPHTVDTFFETLYQSGYIYQSRHSILVKEFLRTTDCEKIMVGSLGLWGRASLEVANRDQVDSYHLPHGVVTQYYPNSYPTTQFVTNDLEIQYLQENTDRFNLSNLRPLGRPKLQKLEQRSQANNLEKGGSLKILLATRPFPNSVRRDFVSDIVSSSSIEHEFVVKIHPRESTALYENIQSQQDYEFTIKTDRLYDHIKRSDLVITTNSNVGLEAVLLGTPCVLYNKWHPRIRYLPAFEILHFKCIENEIELNRFFEQMSVTELKTLLQTQRKSLVSEYLNSKNSLNKIIEEINDRH